MKIPKILLSLLLSLFSISSYGDIYAQSGYEEGKDGVLLLTEKCPGSAGEAGFKIAVIRANGNAMQGCYVKNNRGNFVTKWQDGSIAEIPSNIFIINDKKSSSNENILKNPPAKPSSAPRSECQQLYQAWVFNDLLEQACNFNLGVAKNIGESAKSICQNISEKQIKSWGIEVMKSVKEDISKAGDEEFCRSNTPGYKELSK